MANSTVAVDQVANNWVVRISGPLTTASENDVVTSVHEGLIFFTGNNGNLVIDLMQEVLTPSLIRKLSPALQELKKNKRCLYILHASRESAALVTEMAVDGLIKFAANLFSITGPEANLEIPKSAPKLDVSYINPFIDSVVSTLKVQCSVDVVPGKLFLKSKGPSINVDIAAVIGLTSEGFMGSVNICFPKEVFLGIMSKMLGETFTEITQDIQDGAGELLNIIFGQAKKVLNERGFSFEKAIPTIVTGDSLKTTHLTPSPTIVVPFTCEFGPIHIEVTTQTSA